MGKNFDTIEKNTFGSEYLAEGYGYCRKYDEIVFVGTCTDICVISNVLTYKAFHPETPLVVYADLCAGLTKEKHEAALEVMRSCQVNVLNYKDRDNHQEEEVQDFQVVFFLFLLVLFFLNSYLYFLLFLIY